jgi:hypothetical protein
MARVTLQHEKGLRFNCPVCKATLVDAAYFELHWTLGWIPLGRERFLRCGFCEQESMLKASAPEVTKISTGDWSNFLIPPSGTEGIFLATRAILFFWVPLIGFWLSTRAFRMTVNTHGLPKLVSISALIMSLLFTGGFIMAAVLVPIMILVFQAIG